MSSIEGIRTLISSIDAKLDYAVGDLTGHVNSLRARITELETTVNDLRDRIAEIDSTSKSTPASASSARSTVSTKTVGSAKS